MLLLLTLQAFISARKRSAHRHTELTGGSGMSLPLSLAPLNNSVFHHEVVQEQPRASESAPSPLSSWDVLQGEERLEKETLVRTPTLACTSCERPRRRDNCSIL